MIFCMKGKQIEIKKILKVLVSFNLSLAKKKLKVLLLAKSTEYQLTE